MSEYKPTFYRENEYGRYVECPNPSSIGCCLQDTRYLNIRDNQGNNIRIMSPVLAKIESFEIKEPDYRNRRAVFITIHFDDGSVQMMKSFEHKR